MTAAPTGPAASAVPPPPPSPPDRPPLRRRREGRILGGVAAGLADHLGVDVAIVRILFVVVTVVTMPFGLLAYVLGVLFIPVAQPGELPASRSAARANGRGTGPLVGRDPAFWVGVALLVVGALWILGGPLAPTRLVPGLFGRDLLWPLVLIAFGLALWRASDRSTPPASPAPATPSDPAAAAATSRPHATASFSQSTETTVSTHDTVNVDRPAGPDGSTQPMDTAASGIHAYDPRYGGATVPPTPPSPPSGEGGGQPPAWSPPPERPRERSLLTRLTFGVALVIVGVLWLLGAMNVITVGPGRLTAAALLVVGVGLLVGSVVGRGRWLILIGGLLLPVVIFAELLRPYGFDDFPRFDPRGPHGQVDESPTTVEELADSYRLGAGAITLDLSDLELDESATSRVEVGAGEIVVRLPEDATVDVTARVGVGQVTLDGRSTGGIGQQRTQQFELGDGSQELDLELQVGFGEVDVYAPSVPDLPEDGAEDELPALPSAARVPTAPVPTAPVPAPVQAGR